MFIVIKLVVLLIGLLLFGFALQIDIPQQAAIEEMNNGFLSERTKKDLLIWNSAKWGGLLILILGMGLPWKRTIVKDRSKIKLDDVEARLQSGPDQPSQRAQSNSQNIEQSIEGLSSEHKIIEIEQNDLSERERLEADKIAAEEALKKWDENNYSQIKTPVNVLKHQDIAARIAHSAQA